MAAQLGEFGHRLRFRRHPPLAECLHEQRQALLGRHHPERDPLGAVQVHQPRPAGDQDQTAGGGWQQRPYLCGVARVVEQKQHPPAREGGPPQRRPATLVLGDPLVGDAEGAQQRAEHGGRLQGFLAGGVAAQVEAEPPVRVLVGELVGGAHREGGLAAAAHAVDGHDPRPVTGFGGVPQQGAQFLLAAGEVGEVVGERGQRRRGGRGLRGGGGLLRLGAGQLVAVAQDRLVQLGQPGARVDAEFRDEHVPHPAELLQGLGRAARAVQGEHQLAAQGLAQRMLDYQLA